MTRRCIRLENSWLIAFVESLVFFVVPAAFLQVKSSLEFHVSCLKWFDAHGDNSAIVLVMTSLHDSLMCNNLRHHPLLCDILEPVFINSLA